MPDKILVAVAWPYASGSRHLGHVAGFGVPSDVFARYHRLKGNDVLMVSGTDEHGTPITVRAEKEGKTPQELVDFYSQEIGDNLQTLGCSYNLFTRTTTVNHYAVTQELFTGLYKNGYIFAKVMPAVYCENCQRFLPDRYVEGTCPHCGDSGARGDQCDSCGKQLDPVDLIEPRCKICGTLPVTRDTEHFFLDLPAFGDRLRAWVEKQDHWRSNVQKFTLGLLQESLQPRAITRDILWGIPIPDFLGEFPDKRIYVWFDAVIGYLSASMEWAKYLYGDADKWKEWWLNPQARHYYFMGKDNIVFHSVIWPSMLMGYNEGDRGTGCAGADYVQGAPQGVGLSLPYDVVSSEFLTMEGRKFSTSRNVAVWLPDFFARYDADPLRYFLMINGPESADSDFTWSEFLRRNNDELVATWGNLAHRVLSFTYKNFQAVPRPGALADVDQAMLTAAEAAFGTVGGHLEAARFKLAITEAMALAQKANQYLNVKAPWQTIKTDRQAAATTLYVALRVIDSLKILLCPFLPHTCQRLHEYLGYDGFIAGPLEFKTIDEGNGRTHRGLTCEPTTWVGKWEPSALQADQALRPPLALFKKLDDGIVAEELARMEGTA
jgi:methionyl-tRNA synthetase